MNIYTNAVVFTAGYQSVHGFIMNTKLRPTINYQDYYKLNPNINNHGYYKMSPNINYHDFYKLSPTINYHDYYKLSPTLKPCSEDFRQIKSLLKCSLNLMKTWLGTS